MVDFFCENICEINEVLLSLVDGVLLSLAAAAGDEVSGEPTPLEVADTVLLNTVAWCESTAELFPRTALAFAARPASVTI